MGYHLPHIASTIQLKKVEILLKLRCDIKGLTECTSACRYLFIDIAWSYNVIWKLLMSFGIALQLIAPLFVNKNLTNKSTLEAQCIKIGMSRLSILPVMHRYDFNIEKNTLPHRESLFLSTLNPMFSILFLPFPTSRLDRTPLWVRTRNFILDEQQTLRQ